MINVDDRRPCEYDHAPAISANHCYCGAMTRIRVNGRPFCTRHWRNEERRVAREAEYEETGIRPERCAWVSADGHYGCYVDTLGRYDGKPYCHQHRTAMEKRAERDRTLSIDEWLAEDEIAARAERAAYCQWFEDEAKRKEKTK